MCSRDLFVTTHKIGCAAGTWKIHVLMLSLPVHQYVFSEVLKKTLLNKKDKKQETATKREDVPFK